MTTATQPDSSGTGSGSGSDYELQAERASVAAKHWAVQVGLTDCSSHVPQRFCGALDDPDGLQGAALTPEEIGMLWVMLTPAERIAVMLAGSVEVVSLSWNISHWAGTPGRGRMLAEFGLWS